MLRRQMYHSIDNNELISHVSLYCGALRRDVFRKALAAILCCMVIGGCADDVSVGLPHELCNNEFISLGQDLSSIRRYHSLRELDSVDGYLLDGSIGSSYFSTCYINGELEWIFFEPKSVQSIILEGKQPRDSGVSRVQVKFIVSQLLTTYGEITYIGDFKHIYTDDPRAMLVWHNDSCTVTFTYLPVNELITPSLNLHNLYSGYRLDLRYKLGDSDQTIRPSKVFTEHRLGLEHLIKQ